MGQVVMLKLQNAFWKNIDPSINGYSNAIARLLTAVDEDRLRDLVDLIPCAAECGRWEPEDDIIECTECHRMFCDSCYDTEKGDGCHCHPSVGETVIDMDSFLQNACMHIHSSWQNAEGRPLTPEELQALNIMLETFFEVKQS